MSDHDYTSDEVREVLREMGKNVSNEEELMYLTREVNIELPPSDHSDPEIIDLNESIFASLSIDPELRWRKKPPTMMTPESPDPSANCLDDYVCSPIVSRRRKGGYEAVNYPKTNGLSNFSQEASSLVKEAYESIHRAYAACHNAGKVSKMMQKVNNELDKIDQRKKSNEEGNQDIDLDLADEDEDEEEMEEDEEIEYEGSEARSKSEKDLVIMDPSYRPVLNPKPGKAPFKCDPVTRFHLYKEEWARHPAPGEERRLALRWKLRDKLLNYDIPSIQHPFRKAEHPKDWSPKPYLD